MFFTDKFILPLIFSFISVVQSDELWSKTFDYSFSCAAPEEIKQLEDSTFILVGTVQTDSATSPSVDVFLERIDQSGTTIWTKFYDHRHQDQGLKIMVLDDSGFLVVARVHQSQNTDSIWILRTDINGDTLWTETIGSDYHVYPRAICATPDSGFIIVGNKKNQTTQTQKFWIVKIDAHAKVVWEHEYGSYFTWSIFPIEGANKYIVSACTTEAIKPPSYFFTIDSTGAIIGSTRFDQIYGQLFAFPYNNEIIAGGYVANLPKNPDLLFFKADVSGSIIWQHLFRAGYIDEPKFSIAQNGNIYLATALQGAAFGDSCNIAVLDVTSNGSIVQSEIIYNRSSNTVKSIKSIFGGGYIIASGKTIYEQQHLECDVFLRCATNHFRTTTTSFPILISGVLTNQSATQLVVNNFDFSEYADSIAIRYSFDSSSVYPPAEPNLVLPVDSLQKIFITDVLPDTIYYFSISYRNIFGAWSEITPLNITKLVTSQDTLPQNSIERFAFTPNIAPTAPSYLHFSWSPMEFDDKRIKWIGISIDTSSYPVIDSTHSPQFIFNRAVEGKLW